MANSANISANASVHQPIRDRTHAGDRLVSEISPAGKVMESWHIQFEKAE
ncbi:hypothetical protein [Peribacillus frigoritolerans]|nr:hypothetical protein [Peribacillus frigoritolerans]MDF1995879.1 hypothetical protein [Peribacillus frigoritolerans]